MVNSGGDGRRDSRGRTPVGRRPPAGRRRNWTLPRVHGVWLLTAGVDAGTEVGRQTWAIRVHSRTVLQPEATGERASGHGRVDGSASRVWRRARHPAHHRSDVGANSRGPRNHRRCACQWAKGAGGGLPVRLWFHHRWRRLPASGQLSEEHGARLPGHHRSVQHEASGQEALTKNWSPTPRARQSSSTTPRRRP